MDNDLNFDHDSFDGLDAELSMDHDSWMEAMLR